MWAKFCLPTGLSTISGNMSVNDYDEWPVWTAFVPAMPERAPDRTGKPVRLRRATLDAAGRRNHRHGRDTCRYTQTRWMQRTGQGMQSYYRLRTEPLCPMPPAPSLPGF